MTKFKRTKAEKKLNTEAVAKHYKKNKFEIQKKRKLRDIEKGVDVRPATVVKYGLEEEAKKHGIKIEDKSKTNNIMSLRSINKHDQELKKKIEKKLDEYDTEISKLVEAKVNMARKIAKGEPRIEENKKITWDNVNTFIDQTANFTHATKKGYRGTLKTMVEKIFKCNPDVDIANCFNEYETVIKNIKTAKNSKTKKPYQSLGRFYSLPLSLAKYIPEFDDRFTPAAKKAYKSQLDVVIELNEVKMLEKHQDMIIDWKEVLRARTWWKEEYDDNNDLYSLMGYTIMSLYTYIPPLRNDFGCVRIVHEEPMDKKHNYYWVEMGAFYLNIFKTMKRYRDEPPIIFPPTLKKIVNTWIAKSKAKNWLFSKQNSDPFAGCIGHDKANSFASVVKKVASRFFQKEGQPPVSINVLRKSKVTSMKGKGVEIRQETARKMRHSISTASKAYMRTSYSTDSQQSAVESDED
jgi:hypothetical protein